MEIKSIGMDDVYRSSDVQVVPLSEIEREGAAIFTQVDVFAEFDDSFMDDWSHGDMVAAQAVREHAVEDAIARVEAVRQYKLAESMMDALLTRIQLAMTEAELLAITEEVVQFDAKNRLNRHPLGKRLLKPIVRHAKRVQDGEACVVHGVTFPCVMVNARGSAAKVYSRGQYYYHAKNGYVPEAFRKYLSC